MFSKQIEHEYLFIDKELYFRNQRQFGPSLLFVVIAMLCCYVDPKTGWYSPQNKFQAKNSVIIDSLHITDEFVVIKC